MSYTTSRAFDWSARGIIADRRATTSSRHPGVTFAGSVYRPRGTLEQCDECGGTRLMLAGGPHAPRWTTRSGRAVQVDCIGRKVSP